MRRLALALALALALVGALAVPAAHAQRATEQFIPIGQSPGASGKLTWIGEIKATDARARTLTLAEPGGEHTVKLTDRTRVFLDRSKLKQTSLAGGFEDLKPGRRAEVKWDPRAEAPTADWVKVEISQP